MKNLIRSLFVPFAAMLVACSSQQKTSTDNAATDSGAVAPKEFYAEMKIKDTILIGDPVELTFKVTNGTDSVKSFLKWQTPFEPLLSKYLDVKDEQGNEVPYIGAMAKRMMPPPAEAHLKVDPKDSLSAKVDLLKGYGIEKPGKYTITFNSSEMNGLKVAAPASFVYKAK